MSTRSTLELSIGLPIENLSLFLKEVGLKDQYSHEINFKGKVGDADQIYRILPLPPRGGNERPIKNFRNAVFVRMFFFPQLLQIPLSKRLFENSLKYMNYLMANLKSHITISVMANAILELLPIKPSMTFPMKYSLMTQVMWAEKKV